MNSTELKAFLELLMVSDPWPLQWGHEIVTDFADAEARAGTDLITGQMPITSFEDKHDLRPNARCRPE